MNEKNLRPFTSETGKIGGQKSGEARREKKKIKELIADIMEQEVPSMDTMFVTEEYKMECFTNAVMIAIAMVNKAKSGDIRAMKLLFELTGELERNKVTVNNVVEKDEDTELYQKGFNAAQESFFKVLTDKELFSIIARLEGKKEPVSEEFTPDGKLIMKTAIK